MRGIVLPEEWGGSTISDVSIKCAQRKPKDDETFLYVDIGSIDRDIKIISSPQRLTGVHAPSRARKVINTGDILVSLTRPNLNAVAFVSDDFDNQIASTGFEVIKPLIVDSKLIFFLTRTKDFIDFISGSVQGALYPAAKSSDVQSYFFPLPPLHEQKIIVEKIDNLLVQVENIKAHLERIPKILKQFRQSVLTAAVSGRLTEEWRGKTNEKWKEFVLLDICRSISDGDHQAPPKAEQGIPFLVISDVSNKKIDFESINRWVPNSYYDSLKSIRKPELHDILYTVTGSFGIPVVVNTAAPFCFQRHIAIIKPNHEKVNHKYLALFLESPDALKYAESVATGTAQKTVSLTSLRNLSLSLPALEEQIEIINRVEKFFVYAETIELQVKNARAQVNGLTQSILAKAFRGELTEQWRKENLKLIGGGNSALALLEKIKARRDVLNAQPKKEKKVGVKIKVGTPMNKKLKVFDVLKAAGKPLSGQQLLSAAGYSNDSSTEQLEQFFLDVREAIMTDKTIIKIERSSKGQDLFAPAEPL